MLERVGGAITGSAAAVALVLVTTSAQTTSAVAAAADVEPVTTMVSRFDERFAQYRGVRGFDDGSTFGRWRVVFDGTRPGHGVTIARRHLRLDPEAVSDPGQTRAALVVSRRSFDSTSLHLASTWVTEHQNRQGSPNPWEVGWLIWDYQSPERFTYLVLKPNGWEIGRRDPGAPGGQRFVATGEDLLTPIGMERSVTVDRIGSRATVRADGRMLATFDLPQWETAGAVGMYSEDALVDWTRVYVATSID